VFIVSGELTKTLVAALSHNPICVNLYKYTSAMDFKPMLFAQRLSYIAETSVGTSLPLGPMLSITGSNVDISTPFANEYLDSTKRNTNAAGETFTFNSTSPKMKL
jgi:hypothetical protein